MPNHHATPSRSFSDLLDIMHLLRRECPWDRKQTHASIRDLMVEEIYEAIEAIDNQEYDELKKELGDILLHVVFHAEMAQEQHHFDMGDVIYALQEKLIRRHPHVFENTDLKDADAVKQSWESIKQKENGRKSVLQGVPAQLPGLLRAQRMQEKAGAVGFDWQTWPEAWKKLEEELQELKEVLAEKTASNERKEDEMGDVFFSLVNVARLSGLDAETALRATNNKFTRRFSYIEKRLEEQGRRLGEVSLDDMDVLWNEAKEKLG
ncbi:MAG: nucleoside triphosphate pyrophosphohydrolase [Cyclonatronaceae bacterium]